ncbi:hypothetical protein HRF69_13335 [Bacillus circulans]|uniref:hypothetical protein n=1 Tax=Niallia circulans TaxID=1397 RepID=UPI0015610040|nr:hypothetical protein [Niallia circulans]NRG28101.1 hypothetical protein [Niallia circulans]
MYKYFKDFLISHNFLPYGSWNFIKINHKNDSNKIEEKRKIRETLKDAGCGVYIYTNPKKDVLYVGEGILKDRLIRHYEKSYQVKVKGSPRYDFFNNQKEEMIVYFKSMDDKYERQAIEAMLIVVLHPIYNKILNS